MPAPAPTANNGKAFQYTVLGLLVLAGCLLAACGETNHVSPGGAPPAAPATPATPAATSSSPTAATATGKPGATAPATSATATSAADATPIPAPPGSTLAAIRAAGVLKWGADCEGGAPFVNRDPANPDHIIGFEMDIMDAFCKHLGVKPERVQGEWDSLIDNLKAKRTDMVVNGIEINAERKKQVAFSQPYYVYEQQLTVRAADKAKYKSLADLKGHKIAVLGGAEAQHVVERAGFSDDRIAKYDDSQTPYQELEIKRVDAVLQEAIIARFYAGDKPQLYNVPQTFAPGEYAFTLRPTDPALLRETDRILTLMKKDGELAAIYTHWHMLNATQKKIGIE
ncbi:MAG: transporter substrate-binding domain-containing protein [Planctomycetota bacterium]